MTESASLQISELFYSIQGESTRAGLPCGFIRLTGCNLRCSYCDSRYTWDETGTDWTVDGILDWLRSYPGVMVEITGGEPLLQKAVYPLMARLLSNGRQVLLETSGSMGIERVPAAVSVILDVKCPASGMKDTVAWQNLAMLKTRRAAGSRDEVKFVLSSEEDFFWAEDVVRQHQLAGTVPVLFAPVIGRMSPARLAELILAERLPVRLQLQLHTRIWPDVERGV